MSRGCEVVGLETEEGASELFPGLDAGSILLPATFISACTPERHRSPTTRVEPIKTKSLYCYASHNRPDMTREKRKLWVLQVNVQLSLLGAFPSSTTTLPSITSVAERHPDLIIAFHPSKHYFDLLLQNSFLPPTLSSWWYCTKGRTSHLG